MKAAEVMTRAVVTVPPTASLADAIRLMLEQRVSGLPVVDDGGYLLGLLTDGDLLRRVETGTERRRSAWLDLLFGPAQSAEDYVRSRGRRVWELMTRDVVTVPMTRGSKTSSNSWRSAESGVSRLCATAG